MAKADIEFPSFVKGHTVWEPKAKSKDGAITVKCGKAGRITVPAGSDAKTVIAAVRVYAKAHGWAEVA